MTFAVLGEGERQEWGGGGMTALASGYDTGLKPAHLPSPLSPRGP